MMIVNGLVLLSISLAIASIAFVFFVAKNLGQRLQTTMEESKCLNHKMQFLTTGALGMGHRILALEERLKTLSAHDSLVNDGDCFAYTQAKQMFDQGADTETVASNCGFSSSEAELMALVQQSIKKESSAV